MFFVNNFCKFIVILLTYFTDLIITHTKDTVYSTLEMSVKEIGQLAVMKEKFRQNRNSFPNFVSEMERRMLVYVEPQQITSKYSELPGLSTEIERKSWVLKPKTIQNDKAVPVIVHLHGAKEHLELSTRYTSLELLFFASRGFMIIEVDYRAASFSESNINIEAQIHDVYNCTIDILKKFSHIHLGPVFLNGFDQGALVAIHLLTKLYRQTLDEAPLEKYYRNIFAGAALTSADYSNVGNIAEQMLSEVSIFLAHAKYN